MDFYRPKSRQSKATCGTARDEEESRRPELLSSHTVSQTLHNALRGRPVRDAKFFSKLSNSRSPV